MAKHASATQTRTVYAVTGSAGDYEDYRWWVVLLYECPAAARRHADRCLTANKKARDQADAANEAMEPLVDEKWEAAHNQAVTRWRRAHRRVDPVGEVFYGEQAHYDVTEMEMATQPPEAGDAANTE